MITLLIFGLILNLGMGSMVHEDSCGIYPSCSQYGAGEWEILEDCSKYIRCSYKDGELVQENLECPGTDLFTNEYGRCVDYHWATQCKIFQEVPCFLSCPRVYLHSAGSGAQYQDKAVGCFRLSGTFAGVNSYYQNQNAMFLSPDALSTQLIAHWLIGETYGAQNGRIRNSKYEWAHCPFTNWDQGWEVQKSLGVWVEDSTMTVTCLSGNDNIGSTTLAPTIKTTTPTATTVRPTTEATTTSDGVTCIREGPVSTAQCNNAFSCCRWNGGWNVVQCHCNNDFVYSEDIEYCTWQDVCFKKDGYSHANVTARAQDHTCDDGLGCYD